MRQQLAERNAQYIFVAGASGGGKVWASESAKCLELF